VRIDLHINQSLAPFDELVACAKRADDGRFDGLWVLDHLASLRPATSAAGSMLDPHVLLGAFASVTSRVRLGVLVNNVVNRPSAVIAGATATLDIASEGRAVLGLGAGAAPGSFFAAEHESLGIELDANLTKRQDRVIAVLDEIRALWSGGRDNNLRFPRPVHDVPTVIGVNSVRLAKLASAAGCGINVRADHPKMRDIVASANTNVGEDAASVWLPFNNALLEPHNPRIEELSSAGVTRIVLLVMSRDDIVSV
jgi:alkanesulfonate monooxygenase SsuD/methylene tetrahydromethanopterin reductase-like flavin-dependent oxidoreductase (luciferase family)